MKPLRGRGDREVLRREHAAAARVVRRCPRRASGRGSRTRRSLAATEPGRPRRRSTRSRELPCPLLSIVTRSIGPSRSPARFRRTWPSIPSAGSGRARGSRRRRARRPSAVAAQPPRRSTSSRRPASISTGTRAATASASSMSRARSTCSGQISARSQRSALGSATSIGASSSPCRATTSSVAGSGGRTLPRSSHSRTAAGPTGRRRRATSCPARVAIDEAIVVEAQVQARAGADLEQRDPTPGLAHAARLASAGRTDRAAMHHAGLRAARVSIRGRSAASLLETEATERGPGGLVGDRSARDRGVEARERPRGLAPLRVLEEQVLHRRVEHVRRRLRAAHARREREQLGIVGDTERVGRVDTGVEASASRPRRSSGRRFASSSTSRPGRWFGRSTMWSRCSVPGAVTS